MGHADVPMTEVRLHQFLASFDPQTLRESPFEVLTELIAQRLDRLPLPGKGQTWTRWHALAQVSGFDLSLGKLFESHADALAILAELGEGEPASSTSWGVWCAESKEQRVTAWPAQGRRVKLSGAKAWCSGAAHLSHALASARTPEGERVLVSVGLAQSGIDIDETPWHSPGMANTRTATVRFEGAIGTLIGEPGQYLSRPGFTHGAAGIAACWYGAAHAIAVYLRDRLPQACDPCRAAQLGAIDAYLNAASSVLHDCAMRIDAQPNEAGLRHSLRARLIVEEAANKVLTGAARALGAGPLCTDPWYAQMMTDLPVFLRQSHAERDLARLGELALARRGDAWTL